MQPVDPVFAASLHDGAHVLIAHQYGATGIRSVLKGTGGGASTFAEMPKKTATDHFNMLVFKAAGGAAEGLARELLDCSNAPPNFGLPVTAEQWGKSQNDGTDSDNRQIDKIAQLMLLTGETDELAYPLYVKARATATAILRQRWPLLLTLAARLREAGQLSDPEIRAILDEASTPTPDEAGTQ
jgi:hypothetical protein